MDFRDGSSLQCACESSAGQAQILSGEQVPAFLTGVCVLTAS